MLPAASYAQVQTVEQQQAAPLTEVVVVGNRQRDTGMARVEHYDADEIDRANATSAQELINTLPVGPAGTSLVVLIDGKRTPLNLETLPPEMIERMELNLDGEMPDGGRAEGYVVNIVTRASYTGASANMRHVDSFAGGGGNGDVKVTAGYKRNELNIVLNGTHSEKFALLASEREFSREQDHSAYGKRDLRLPWGDPASVQALDGYLNSMTDAHGQPVSTALAPAASSPGELTVQDFIAGPAGSSSASELRRFNTSEYLYLAAPGETSSASARLMTFPLTDRTKISIDYNYTSSDSTQLAAPPVSVANTINVVPAAYNPFGQEIAVGMVHTGFGPVRRTSSSDAHTGQLHLHGGLSRWQWESTLLMNRVNTHSRSVDLDPRLFAASLAETNDERRFDPFAPDAALYPAMSRLRNGETDVSGRRLQAAARGPISEGWIDPITLRLSTELSDRDSEVHDTLGSSSSVSASTSHNWRARGELNVPLFSVSDYTRPAALRMGLYWQQDEQTNRRSDRPQMSIVNSQKILDTALQVPWIGRNDDRRWAHRLETELSLGRADQSNRSPEDLHRLNLLWAPTEVLAVRADFREELTPPQTIFSVPTVQYNVVLQDRLRNAATTPGVQVSSSLSEALEPTFKRSWLFEVQFDPPWLHDLKLGVNYQIIRQNNIVRVFSAQDILDNATSLAGRVTRSQASEEDISSGEPGVITHVDITPTNLGTRSTRAADLWVHFKARNAPFGSFHLKARARRTFETRDELAPGMPFVTTNRQLNAPDWTLDADATWNLGDWTLRSAVTHRGEGHYGPDSYDAYSTVDIGAAYTFQRFMGERSRGALRLGAEIINIGDESPPRVDTLQGYIGGSPLGRAFQLTLRLPLTGSGSNESEG